MPTTGTIASPEPPVAHALHTHLRHGDPKWLWALDTGARLLLAATMIVTVTLVLLIAWSFITPARGWRVEVVLLALLPAMAGAFFLWTEGVSRLGGPEPGGREPAGHGRVCRALRLSPLVPVLAPVLFCILAITWPTPGEATLAAGVCLVVWPGALALSARLRHLFERLRAPHLARQARAVSGLLSAAAVLLGVVVLLWVIISIVALTDPDTSPSAGLDLEACGGLPVAAGAAMLAAALLWAFLLLRAFRAYLRRMLKHVEKPPVPVDTTPVPPPMWGAYTGAYSALLVISIFVFGRPTVLTGDASVQTTSAETRWGWPMTYRVERTSPPAGVSPGDFSLTALLIDIVVVAVLIVVIARIDKWVTLALHARRVRRAAAARSCEL